MAADQHPSAGPLTGRRLTRWVTLRYAVALVVIALLALGSHAVLERLTTQQDVTGSQVNVAGRQRMLSQRVAAEALARSAPIVGPAGTGPATRERLSARLVADADEMVAAQRALLGGDARRGLPGAPSPALRALYREGEDGGVQHSVDRYADLARAIARTPADDGRTPPMVAELLARSGALLPALDEVVDAYEAQGRDRVDTTTRASWLLLGLTLAVLATEALAVFAPLARRLRATVDDLESTGARLRATVDTATVGVLTLDGRGRVTDVNDALLRLLGSVRARVVGTALSEHVDPATAEALACLVAEAAAGGAPRTERTVVSESRHTFVAELTAATTPPGRDGRSTVVVVTDVTERHAAEQVLLHRAQHDQLTGLPTRAVVGERLLRATVRSRSPRLLALLALDLDGFKAINDVHGHAVGDAVLVAVARRAVVALREGDTVARFGGDEFVVLLEEVDSPGGALVVAQRLAATLREPVTAEGVTVSVGVSIGVAVAKAGGTGPVVSTEASTAPPVAADVGAPDLAQMLRRADLAMYVTKKTGDERPRVYHGRMEVVGRPVEPGRGPPDAREISRSPARS